MLKGIPVQLLQKTNAGLGDRGLSADGWEAVTVENVLVAPLIENSPQEALNQVGHRAVYHLAIPKTNGHVWEGQLVQFFGCTWSVIGVPTMGIDDLVPGPWNKKVVVELYQTAADTVDKLWSDTVTLITQAAEADADGYAGSTSASERAVPAIFTAGILLSDTVEDQKSALRRTATVEIWAAQYLNAQLLEHDDVRYEIRQAKPTGRGTMLLDLQEVWR